MPAKKNSSATKKTGAVAKKRSSGSLARSGDQNASTLPTERDAQFIRDHVRPPPVTDRVFHGITAAFTGRVCATLKKASVGGFYGNRLKPEEIIKNTELAVEATAVAARFTHGAEIATQIAEPALVLLMEQASLIVRDADDLLATHPELSDDLQDLLSWWATTFPGGGPKAKSDGAAATAGATTPPKEGTGG